MTITLCDSTLCSCTDTTANFKRAGFDAKVASASDTSATHADAHVVITPAVADLSDAVVFSFTFTLTTCNAVIAGSATIAAIGITCSITRVATVELPLAARPTTD